MGGGITPHTAVTIEHAATTRKVSGAGRRQAGGALPEVGLARQVELVGRVLGEGLEKGGERVRVWRGVVKAGVGPGETGTKTGPISRSRRLRPMGSWVRVALLTGFALRDVVPAARHLHACLEAARVAGRLARAGG